MRQRSLTSRVASVKRSPSSMVLPRANHAFRAPLYLSCFGQLSTEPPSDVARCDASRRRAVAQDLRFWNRVALGPKNRFVFQGTWARSAEDLRRHPGDEPPATDSMTTRICCHWAPTSCLAQPFRVPREGLRRVLPKRKSDQR